MSLTEPRPSQRGHMPPVMLKLRRSFTVCPARSIVTAPAPLIEATLKENAWARADVRLPEPAEEDAQHRVGVGRGADGGAGVGAHPLLVDDDRGGQPVEDVDLGPRQRRHEALHEGAVGLVDHPLRLRGDRVEHQRALARAGDAGEHRQPALRELDADVLEVVHARAVHADQVVAVGDVQRGRLPVSVRRLRSAVSPSSCSIDVSADAAVSARRAGASPGRAQRTSKMRIMLPAGSRKAQSRTPHGWSVGSWTTSASPACSRSKVPSRSLVARLMLA